MKRKGWFIPILVFFISITGLIFYQQRQDAHSFAQTTDLPPILWSESPTNINKIIYSQYGHTIQAERISDVWKLYLPVVTKADDAYVYNIILNFKQPSFTKAVNTAPDKLQDYGIDSHSPSIKLFTTDKHMYELIRGKLADDLHYYVYAPMADTIYTMPKAAFENIHTDLTEWRDKDLLAFNKNDVQMIVITYQNNTYKLYPAKDVSKNVPNVVFKCADLDEKILNQFVDFLETSTINEFITDTADNNLLTAYGLSTPSLKVKIILKSGKTLTTAIGKTIKSENLCYVSINDSARITTIPYFDFSRLVIEKPKSTSESETAETK